MTQLTQAGQLVEKPALAVTSVVVDPTDAQLLDRVLSGDEGAFELLFQRYAPVLGRRVHRIFGNVSDAEDVLQETFLQVLRALSRYRPKQPFKPWLYAVCFRVAGTCLRSKRRKRWLVWSSPTTEGHSEPGTPSAEDLAIHKQQSQRLYGAIMDLPLKQRIAYTLREIDGMGLAEIAELVGTSPQAVWQRGARS